MACRILLLALFALTGIQINATPLLKRTSHADLFDGNKPLQGVEVNGLFNPMER